MKQVPVDVVGQIVAWQWPSWWRHMSLEPGEWLISTYIGDTARFLLNVGTVKYAPQVDTVLRRAATEAYQLEDEEDEPALREGWILVEAFVRGKGNAD